MKFYLFDDITIIACENKEQAESLYKEEYDNDYTSVEEIEDDFIVGAFESINSYTGGYAEIFLYDVVDRNKKLPFIVDFDLP